MNWWLFGGITAGLLAIGGLVWFLLARRKRKKEEEEYEEYLAEEEIAQVMKVSWKFLKKNSARAKT